jgi:hypothetical protein
MRQTIQLQPDGGKPFGLLAPISKSGQALQVGPERRQAARPPRSRNRGRPYKSAESEPRSVRFDSGQAPAHQTCHSTKRTHRRGCFCGVRLRRRHRHGAYQLHQKHHWCVSLCSACRKRLRRAVRLRSVRLGYRGRGGLYMFLRNEPTVFWFDFRCNGLCTRNLRRNIAEQIGGFVFQNEPTGRG